MVSTILGGEEGWWYDIFRATNLVGNAMVNSTWAWAGQGTNNGSYLLPYVSSPHAFHILGSWEDTDFDGLSDAFERLISRTSTNSVDTDLDGIFDADELGANGLPHFASYAGMTRAVIFTTSGTATEAGGEGQIKIRLPSPAPTSGTTIVIHHGGTAEHEADYRLLKTDGTPVTNDVVFTAGATEMTLRVQAINDTAQSTQPRRVSLALAQSANYELDWRRADVTLLENDLPLVSVVAADSAAGEPGTNTNPGAFLISREGSNTLALSVGFTLSGSATVTTDYTASNSPIIIPAGSNSLTIPVNPVHDTNYEDNETVVLTLQSSSAYAIAANAATGVVTIAENDLPLVYFVGTDLVATEYNSLSPATATMRRTGNASQPLTVPLAIAGTAGATDYQTVPGVIIFATNQTETNITVRPLADTIEEQAETVILTIKGSLSYNVGSSNSVTVHIDDDKQPRYEIVQLKPSSSYHTAHNIDSPAVFDIKRHGRSDAAVNLPFQIVTNQFTPSTFYRVYGDVSGANAVFPAFATKARLNFTAPVTGKTNGSIEFRMTNVDAATYAIWFRPAWDYVEFKVIDTNAVEGSSTPAKVRLSRPVTGPEVSLGVAVSGNATPGADHNASSSFPMTIPQNATSVDANISALTDAFVEGWETIILSPDSHQILSSLNARSPHMAFARENVANPEKLPQTDTDLDGLPDRWEIANDFDPFDPAEANLDTDKDGVINVDEFSAALNPRLPDSDNDGKSDLLEFLGPDDLGGSDYVEIRLRTRDTGKVNNGANCAVCHTTELKVGDYSHFSPTRGLPSEKTFFFRKGSNYNIHLSELVRNLERPNQDTGNPHTSAT
jgi:hypothetical protein